MTIAQISVPLLIWVLLTALIMAVARRYRTEDSSFYVGCLFLALTVIAVLGIHFAFDEILRCQVDSCRHAKVQVETLIQFILISWGALGGSLLAKTMENK